MNKNKIVGIAFLGFVLLAFSVKTGEILSKRYENHIAISISIVVFLILILSFFGIYKLAERKKKIEKQVDEYFENKEK